MQHLLPGELHDEGQAVQHRNLYSMGTMTVRAGEMPRIGLIGLNPLSVGPRKTVACLC